MVARNVITTREYYIRSIHKRQVQLSNYLLIGRECEKWYVEVKRYEFCYLINGHYILYILPDLPFRRMLPLKQVTLILVQLHESTNVKERYIWCDGKYTEIIFNHTQINIIITTLLQFISCVVCVLIVVFSLKIMNVLQCGRKWDVKENQERKYFNDISIQYVASVFPKFLLDIFRLLHFLTKLLVNTFEFSYKNDDIK